MLEITKDAYILNVYQGEKSKTKYIFTSYSNTLNKAKNKITDVL